MWVDIAKLYCSTLYWNRLRVHHICLLSLWEQNSPFQICKSNWVYRSLQGKWNSVESHSGRQHPNDIKEQDDRIDVALFRILWKRLAFSRPNSPDRYSHEGHVRRERSLLLRQRTCVTVKWFARLIRCIRATKRSSFRTSELTNSIATPSRCSKSATGLPEV